MAPAVNPLTSTWIYNTTTGEIKHVSMWTWTFDYSWRGIWIPFDSQAKAQAYAKAHPVKKNDPISGIAGGIVGADPKQAAKGVGDAASSVTSDVLKPLFQGNIWLRVVEVGLGIVLIVVGLVKLAPPSVKSAAKVAALL